MFAFLEFQQLPAQEIKQPGHVPVVVLEFVKDFGHRPVPHGFAWLDGYFLKKTKRNGFDLGQVGRINLKG